MSFSAKDIDDLYTEWSMQTGSRLHTDPFETVIELPPQIGNGWVRRIRLRPGLEMTLKHFEFPELFVAEMPDSFNWQIIEFTSSLSGSIKGTIHGIQDEYCIAPRQSINRMQAQMLTSQRMISSPRWMKSTQPYGVKNCASSLL